MIENFVKEFPTAGRKKVSTIENLAKGNNIGKIGESGETRCDVVLGQVQQTLTFAKPF
jgi:hypothetical protein